MTHPPTPATTPPTRILVVEDEAHLALLITLNLEAEGYRVTHVDTLTAARQALAGRPDLLVLDVMLPDGDGRQLCMELRAAGDQLPVLMLTALGTSRDVVAGLEAGADDYLPKPFALDVLLARVQALLRRRAWSQPPTPDRVTSATAADRLAFGRAAVDFRAGVVLVGGVREDVTALELKLLRYFAEHEGLPVSREDLLRNVWGVSPDVSTRTVDNFVVRLRRMFEDDPAVPRYFITVRGVGYRFERGP